MKIGCKLLNIYIVDQVIHLYYKTDTVENLYINVNIIVPSIQKNCSSIVYLYVFKCQSWTLQYGGDTGV